MAAAVSCGREAHGGPAKKQWNAIKHERYPWVDEVHKDANQRPFTNLGIALSKFFRHEAQYPRFKKRCVLNAAWSLTVCHSASGCLRVPVAS